MWNFLQHPTEIKAFKKGPPGFTKTDQCRIHLSQGTMPSSVVRPTVCMLPGQTVVDAHDGTQHPRLSLLKDPRTKKTQYNIYINSPIQTTKPKTHPPVDAP